MCDRKHTLTHTLTDVMRCEKPFSVPVVGRTQRLCYCTQSDMRSLHGDMRAQRTPGASVLPVCLCFLQIPADFLRSFGIFPAVDEVFIDASTEQEVEAGDAVPEEEAPCGTTRVQVASVGLPAPFGLLRGERWLLVKVSLSLQDMVDILHETGLR